MVDDLRRELTQVARRCEGIILNGKDVNKILNGKFKEVIEDFEKEPKSPTMVEDTNEEPVPTDEQEVPSLSNYSKD